MDPTSALFVLHQGLPRQGPGSDACTREALRRLPPLPSRPRVLDLGCGPGRHTLVLADTLRTQVVGLDFHQPFLDQLRETARERGLTDLVETRRGDMAAPPGVEPGSLDLIWSEGAIYNLGFAPGLGLWRPLLAPGGLVAATECSWLVDDRPAEAVAFWAGAYPAMGSVAENVVAAEAAGFEVLDSLALPPSAWWDEYYTPLLENAGRLRPTADAELVAAIEATEREIEMYQRFGHSYGYVFYLMRRTD
jgi:SAM-dependent methyltransferase